MTSEVIVLNKRAVVLAADSAVTTSHDGGNRYSKAANKLFDATSGGNIAVAIYGSALIDSVPWEVVLKLFRTQSREQPFPTVSAYVDALLSYLERNAILFPDSLRSTFVGHQFDRAVRAILEYVVAAHKAVVDPASEMANRQARWAEAASSIRSSLNVVAHGLATDALDAHLMDLESWIERVTANLANLSAFEAIDRRELAELAHRLRYARPQDILGDSGLVAAGFGTDQIFPAYRQVKIYGHVGDQLYVVEESEMQIDHECEPVIKGLAQTSMIDTFTNGFGESLYTHVSKAHLSATKQIFEDLLAAGVAIPDDVRSSISHQSQERFTKDWLGQNVRENFAPLQRVIHGLGVEEMANLAETLVVLESLKERVTSSSESIGGPIDVAVVTKAEGLVWVKRKHYFDAESNLRYVTRSNRI